MTWHLQLSFQFPLHAIYPNEETVGKETNRSAIGLDFGVSGERSEDYDQCRPLGLAPLATQTSKCLSAQKSGSAYFSLIE